MPDVCCFASYVLSIQHSINGVLIASPAAGYRNHGDAALNNVGSNGYFWTFAPNSQSNARNLNFNSGNVNPLNNNNRANGFAVWGVRELGRRWVVCFLYKMKYGYKHIHELVTLAYLDARRHERTTPAQLEFEVSLEANIAELAHELYVRSWMPAPMRWFVLDSPTIREVFAPQFRDRVVSHILFNLISPVFERYFIYDSFSCRKGKGTLFGIERFEHHIRSVTDNYRKDAYCLNLDISGYFMSIQRGLLYEIVWRTLGKYRAKAPDDMDYEFVDYLIATYLSRDPVKDCEFIGNPHLVRLVPANKSQFGRKGDEGLPIGDIGNQLYANIYLDVLDQFVKRELRAKHYCRYVDDGRDLRNNYYELIRDKERIGDFLERELRLTLHPEKTTITNVYDTNYFLGAAIKPYRRYIKNDSAARFKKGMIDTDRKLREGVYVDMDSILADINARLGYMSHFNEYKMIRRTLSRTPAILERFEITNNFHKAIIKQ